MQSVLDGDFFLGTEIGDKLAGTLALGKIVVVTGLNSDFPFSVGDLVTTTFTAEICDGFPDVYIDDKLAVT